MVDKNSNKNQDSPPSPGMDMNAYSHYYYSTYYPEYYAQLHAAAFANPSSGSGAAIPPHSSVTTTTTTPALGSRVAGEKAFRQMAHYFDYEAYNASVNQEFKDGKRIPMKFTKQEINVLKQRKLDRKKKRMLDWLHND